MGEPLERFLLFTGLAANVAFVYFPTVAYANILWSVAVEEQFYLFWPHVITLKRNLFWIMLLLLVGYLALKFYSGNLDRQLELLVIRTRFSAMIIGGIGAYLVFTKHALIRYVYARMTQVFLFLLFGLLLLERVDFMSLELFQDEFLALVVCGLILNIATNRNSILKLEHPLLNYFGKISYGLYVYHLFAVVIVLKLLPAVLPIQDWSPWISYPVSLGLILLLTTGISYLSYRYFESYFLRKKVKFSTVVSGDLVETKEMQEPRD
jgi:peptidoglycan/LPS O-acetylase OafA/YrhL